MSDDGAHLGYGMHDALEGALGGKEPEHRMTATEMREYILTAPDVPTDYDEFGRTTAKLFLEFMERHPETATMPADSDFEWPRKADGSTDYAAPYTITREGFYDYIKRVEPDWKASHDDVFSELSGFMYGWAVNAARRCLELPPVPNPAIIHVG